MATKSTSSNETNKGLAIASMVCGIVSLVFCWLWPISSICAIVALVLGIIALAKKYAGKGMAIAGVVTGSLGLVAEVVLIAWLFAIIGGFVGTASGSAIETIINSGGESGQAAYETCIELKGIDASKNVTEMTTEEYNAWLDCLPTPSA